MRFFSNEAQDNVDEPGPDHRAEQARAEQARTEQAQSDPGALPQQRAGSPWQDGPGRTEPPAPQPTAFGASTVGGAVAASAMAGPSQPVGPQTDLTTDAAGGVADDRTVAPGDGARTGDAGRVHPDALGDGDRTVAFGTGPGTDQDRTMPLTGDDDQDRTVALGTVAGSRDDEVAWPAGHTGTEPAAGSRSGADPDRAPGSHRDTGDSARRFAADDHVADGALEDRGTFDDPRLASRTEPDDVVDLPLEDHGTFDDPVIAGAPAPAATTSPSPSQATASVSATDKDQPSGPSPFFPTSDVTALRERWRDVQLRFVDDPKGATAEAAGLVDEAVDKLTEALRQQRGGLAKGSDDTEALRVELRSYRDILDRLLGL